jgi:two-component system, cell cycle sensor histidine kinase and response regulator CckA
MRTCVREQLHFSLNADSALAPSRQSRALARILVVDDEQVVRELVQHFLALEGYEVDCAEDGVDALVKYRAVPGRYQLVILDLLMPRMGGRDAFFELRQTDAHLPILIMSAYAPQEQAADVIGQRMSAFLNKPFILGDLLLRVQELLSDAAREADVWSRRANSDPFKELEL